MGLTKLGSGTLTLGTTNTYTGETTVENGNYTYTVPAPASNTSLSSQVPSSDLTSILDPVDSGGPTAGQSSAPDVTPDTARRLISVDAADGVGTLTYDSRDIGINCGFGPGWSDSDTLPRYCRRRQHRGRAPSPSASAVRPTGLVPTGQPTRPSTAARRRWPTPAESSRLTEPDGATYQFYDFNQTVNPPAAFYQSTTPGGDTVTATYAAGRIANVVYKTERGG